MINSLRRAPAALLLTLLASGCAPARIAVTPDFWNGHDAKIGVAVTPSPVPVAHKAGAQGLLDMAINAAMASDLEKRLAEFDATPFDAVRGDFVDELARRGMTAKVVTGAVDLTKFPDRTSEGEGFHPKNLRALAQQEDVDVLVLLSVRRLGTVRPYYGFIPLGAPKGFFEVTGQMVDLKTNRLLWQVKSDEIASSVASADPWDQAPAFPNVMAAMRTALDNGKVYLKKEFFPGLARPAQVASAAPEGSPIPEGPPRKKKFGGACVESPDCVDGLVCQSARCARP